jgi:hypothetical protein
MSSDLRAQQEMLRQLTRTDPDPRVRRWAHALLLLTQDHPVEGTGEIAAPVSATTKDCPQCRPAILFTLVLAEGCARGLSSSRAPPAR